MNDLDDERAYWRAFRRDLVDRLGSLERKLILANPQTMADEEHDFLIKKLAMFRDNIRQIDEIVASLEDE